MVKLVYLVSIILITIGVKESNFFRSKSLSFQRQFSKEWQSSTQRLFIATQTGKKSKLKALKQVMQDFGMLHLLTPSGVHLSSIVWGMRLSLGKRVFKWIFPLLAIFILGLPGLYSLKRVCYFILFRSHIKNTKLCFVLSFITDLLLGGYASSPLSFALSFLFWGVLIFSKGGRSTTLFNLFAAQLLVAAFFEQRLSYLSIAINPMVTSLFSLSFPLLSFQFWTQTAPALEHLVRFLIEGFEWLLLALNTLSFSLFKPTIGYALTLLFIPRRIWPVAMALCCYTGELNVYNSKEVLAKSFAPSCKLRAFNNELYVKCRSRP